MRVPPHFLDVELDATAEVDGLVFFAHAEAVVVVEGLERSTVVARVVEVHGRASEAPVAGRCIRILTSTRERRRLMMDYAITILNSGKAAR
jgi:hypothetical protein